MQWKAEDNAGFTTGTPWLKVNPDYTKINVQVQESDPDSVLNYYRKLTALRKDPRYVQTFTYGRFVPVRERIPEQVLAYLREDEQQKTAHQQSSQVGFHVLSFLSFPVGD